MGETFWYQKWHTKGCVFLFAVVCTYQNRVFCFFFVVSCTLHTCQPAKQHHRAPWWVLETQQACDPDIIPDQWTRTKPFYPTIAFFFLLFSNQLTFLSSSEMALEGQIRAGLRRNKKSLLSLNLQVPQLYATVISNLTDFWAFAKGPMNEQRVLMKCCWITWFFFCLFCFFAFLEAMEPVEPPWSQASSSPSMNLSHSQPFDDMVLLLPPMVILSQHRPHTCECAVGCRMRVIRLRGL